MFSFFLNTKQNNYDHIKPLEWIWPFYMWGTFTRRMGLACAHLNVDPGL